MHIAASQIDSSKPAPTTRGTSVANSSLRLRGEDVERRLAFFLRNQRKRVEDVREVRSAQLIQACDTGLQRCHRFRVMPPREESGNRGNLTARARRTIRARNRQTLDDPRRD